MTTLSNLGFSRDNDNMPKDPLDCTNTDAYIALKYAIRQHLEQGLWPELSESKKPIGGYNCVMSNRLYGSE